MSKVNLRDRGISRFDVESLFRDVLNMDQIDQISKLLRLLGLYMFLDRDQLDHFAKKTYGETIGLSYIQRAVNHNLIAEIQSEEDLDKYYFQLKSGGIYFLEATFFKFRKMPLYYGRKDREKLLQINQYLVKNNHLLCSEHLLENGAPLITTNNVILLLGVSESDVIEDRFGPFNEDPSIRDSEIQEVYEKFSFETIVLEPIDFSGKAKGNGVSKMV